MIATSGFLAALSAPNSFSAAAAPKIPLGELTALPQTFIWFKGDPTSKGKGTEEGTAP